MQPDEPALVERSKDGDRSAFNAIVVRYQSQVYSVAARILGDRALAEDVAQETFINALSGIRRFRGENLRAWLLRIATNLSLDAARLRKRRPAASLDAAVESGGFAPPSDEPGPEQMALRAELRESIQASISTLPNDQRAALVLIDVEGLSYAEAGEVMGCGVGTVKSRLARARQRMRSALMQKRELLPDQIRHTVRGRTEDV